MNSGAPWPSPTSAQERVLGIQRKLHKWSTEDQDRRFDDLHNLVCDPATLMVAWQRVRANRGSRSAGVDGQTARYIERVGVEKFLGALREELRTGTFRPLPVKERLIPKRDGKKFRRLGVPTVTVYRGVVQRVFGFVGRDASVPSASRRAAGGPV